MKFYSPDKAHSLKFEWKGELGMSGPAYGTMTIDNVLKISGAQPSVLFSNDSKFVVFPVVKFVDVGSNYYPDRSNVRTSLILLNLINKEFRYLSGNKGFAKYNLNEFSNSVLYYSVNGEKKVIEIQKVNWK